VAGCCCKSLSVEEEEEEEALVTFGAACKLSCSFLEQQLLLLMEELLSKSLFHIPNPSAVCDSSTQPENNNPHQQPKAQSARSEKLHFSVGGSGLSPPRASIGTSLSLSLSLSPSLSLCLSTLFHDDDSHDRKSHAAAAAAKIGASTPFVFLEFWLHLKLSQPCYLPKKENTAS
jgi:hypothetical protein